MADWLAYGWDYFAGTSWLGIADEVLDALPQGEVKRAKRMQYKGTSGSGWFAGECFQTNGNQETFRHFMLTVSGTLADSLRPLGDALPGATRLDLQVTVPMPPAFRLVSVAWGLQQRSYGSFNRRGRYPCISFISSDTTTLYIGKRGKGRMVRIYEKDCSEGVRHIRFEVEYAGDLAEEYQYKTEDKDIVRALRGEFRTLPEKAREQMSFVDDALYSAYHGAYRLRAADKERDTFKWLMNAMGTGLKMELNIGQRKLLCDAARALCKRHEVDNDAYERWLTSGR